MLNDRQCALAPIERALKVAPKDGIVLFRAAQVYNRLGDHKRTLDYLQHAVNSGYSPTVIRDTPDFASLNSEAAFVSLVAAK